MFSVTCEPHPLACRIQPLMPSSHLFPTCSPTSSHSSLLSVSGTFQVLPCLCNSLCLECPPSSSSLQVYLILILQGSAQRPPSERPALNTPSEKPPPALVISFTSISLLSSQCRAHLMSSQSLINCVFCWHVSSGVGGQGLGLVPLCIHPQPLAPEVAID